MVLLAGVVVVVTGVGLLGYRYYTRPATLTVAVGSIDGEAAKAMSAIAGQLVSTNAPVRLKVIDSGTALEAAKAFAAGKVDLAVVRGDVGDLSQAQAVVGRQPYGRADHRAAGIVHRQHKCTEGPHGRRGRRSRRTPKLSMC